MDLRALVVDDLFAADRTTVTTDPVVFSLRLCRPLDTSQAPTLRVDLHPRTDTPGGADTDYAEDPTRWLLLVPPPNPAGSWRWELHADDGPGPTLVTQGMAQRTGAPDQVTALAASVPADEVRAAGDADATSATGLPPIALRACSTADGCGPGYTHDGQRNVITNGTGRPDVDYLPEPRHLPVTYPSVCQVGTVPSADRAGSAQAGHAPGQVVVDPATAGRLTARGWSRVGELPDGRVVFRGTSEQVRRVAPGAGTSTVGLRRASVVPSDPLYPADGPEAPTGQWGLRRLDAPSAWDVTTGGTGAPVAVLDSGFDGAHPDLAGRAVAGRDWVPTRVDGARPLDVAADTDLGGHGSFIASLIAASTDDATGMAGLGWDTPVLVGRVFDAEACASDAAIIDAMRWAVDQGAAAINLSLGGPQPSGALDQAGQEARAAGVVPIAAAGNRGGADIEYPAYYDAYLSVAATGYIDPASTQQDPIASYSTRNDGIDLAAPGGSADGQVAHDLLGACWEDAVTGRGHCRMAGTSFATPLVAATVALARAEQPRRTVTGVLELLADTALDLTTCAQCGPGVDAASGHGRMRTGVALSWLGGREETLELVGTTSDPIAGSVAASQRTFPLLQARAAVIARHDVYADALAGAPLAGESGPILLTPTSALDDRVARELVRALPQGATVFLLGGEQALSRQVEDEVRRLGYVPQRLAGPSRIETAAAIGERVGGGGQVLVASGANWPDAIAGGVYAADRGVPLLLTWPAAAPQATTTTLQRLAPSEVVLLGGPAAISDGVRQQLDAAGPWTTRRIQGPHRWATATAVTTQLWGRTSGTAGDGFTLVNGQLESGWAFGLAISPLAARMDAPLLLTTDDPTFDEPRRLLREQLGYRLVRPASAVMIGPPTVDPALADDALQRLRELLGG